MFRSRAEGNPPSTIMLDNEREWAITRFDRRYRLLRIPRTIVERWVLEWGGRITVPPVNVKTAKAMKSVSEDDLVRDLAVLASQYGDAARKTLERIARRAKSMTYVPQDQWEDMAFFPDEDEG